MFQGRIGALGIIRGSNGQCVIQVGPYPEGQELGVVHTGQYFRKGHVIVGFSSGFQGFHKGREFFLLVLQIIVFFVEGLALEFQGFVGGRTVVRDAEMQNAADGVEQGHVFFHFLEALVEILAPLAHQLMVLVEVGLLHFLPDQFTIFRDFGDTVVETFRVVQQVEDLIRGFFALAFPEQVAHLTHGILESIVIEDHFLVGQNLLSELLLQFQGLVVFLDLLDQFDLAVYGFDRLDHAVQVARNPTHGILQLVGTFLALIGEDIVEGHFDLKAAEGPHIGVIFDALEANAGGFLRGQEDIFVENTHPVDLRLENLFLLLQ